MVSVAVRSSRLVVSTLAALLIVAACTSGADAPASPVASATALPTASPHPTLAPTPSPVPTPAPTPDPTPRSSAAPAKTQASDGAASLRIGSPYKLVANAANSNLTGAISIDVAGKHVTENISGREIWRNGKSIGLALVLEIEGVPMSRALFDGGARGAASNTGGKLSYTTILDTRVAMVTAKLGTFGMYALHDTIVMVVGLKLADTKVLLASVIKANK
jgi:hypothetical protein